MAHADHILGLAMSVFRTDSVLLHLRDGDQVFARGGDDTFTPGIRATVCRLLEPAGKGICVVEDLAADVRYAVSPARSLARGDTNMSWCLAAFSKRSLCRLQITSAAAEGTGS